MRILGTLFSLSLLVGVHAELGYPGPAPYFNWTRNFSLPLARFAFDHAAAAYSATPEDCLRKHGAVLLRRVALPCDRIWDECWAFVSLAEEWIVVAFRGTTDHLQLTVEVLEDIFLPKTPFAPGGAVVHYFKNAFEVVWAELNGTVADAKKEHPDRGILFTGHSLGGALASLASSSFAFEHAAPGDELQLVTFGQPRLVTFGQPRVGNMDFAAAHDALVPNSWRLVHAKDLVPHVPNCFVSILSRGCASYFNHATYHHGTEIWFPEDMRPQALFKICTGSPVNEDKSCSDSYYFKMNITEHTHYFERHVSHYGRCGCKEKASCVLNKTPKGRSPSTSTSKGRL
uniref:Lipase_3 domain-containing protein n=1 Tax=Steinernema glaseri TaxID=37863 RepID=A0A1I8A856_9BILA